MSYILDPYLLIIPDEGATQSEWEKFAIYFYQWTKIIKKQPEAFIGLRKFSIF